MLREKRCKRAWLRLGFPDGKGGLVVDKSCLVALEVDLFAHLGRRQCRLDQGAADNGGRDREMGLSHREVRNDQSREVLGDPTFGSTTWGQEEARAVNARGRVAKRGDALLGQSL